VPIKKGVVWTSVLFIVIVSLITNRKMLLFLAPALELLLDYLYTSEVRLDGKVSELITAAKRLKITSLTSVCNYMEERKP